MTIFYPDISSFQAGISLKGALAVCAKATQGAGYTNPDYARAKSNAAANGTFFFAYHFLMAGGGAAQAAHCYSVARKTPLMLDVEVDGTSRPSISDLTAFADAFRKLGGVIHLVYLPRWYWQEIGSPSLAPLKSRNLHLVSSVYTAYTDAASGAGWQPYDWGSGKLDPIIWQYTDALSFNGQTVDFNAFRGTHPGDQSSAAVAGTLTELKHLVHTGSISAPGPHPGPVPQPAYSEDSMIVLDNLSPTGPAVSLPVPAGKSHVLLYADDGFSRGTTPPAAPSFRVGFSPHWDGAHEVAPHWGKPVDLAVPAGALEVTIARLDPGDIPVTVDWA